MKSIHELAEEITRRKARHDGQLMIAIAGPPASGKSTLAAALMTCVEDANVIAMDGFHLDNSVLRDRDLIDRKGSPESFDVAGFHNLLTRLSTGEEVLAPDFDRDLDLSRAGAVVISPHHPVVVVEGNYLLLREAPWSDLHRFWDMTIMIDIPLDVLRERLRHRWLKLGLGVEKADTKTSQNDLPNAERVQGESVKADLRIGALNL